MVMCIILFFLYFALASVEDFNRIHRVNTLGTYLCYKYAAKQMIEQGHGGRIIGASSLAGKQGKKLKPMK